MGSNCKLICWIIGAIVGLLAYLTMRPGVAMLLALILALLVVFIVGYVLSTLVCKGDTAATDAAATDAATPTPAPVADIQSAGRGNPAAPADEPAAVPEVADATVPAPVAGPGTRPAGLDGARGGQADDLRRIKGVGPKLAETLHEMGFYHFDQIAAWTAEEVAWVDQNLKGFKGRVSRDNWVEQARQLATGEETEFSKRVDKGDVY